MQDCQVELSCKSVASEQANGPEAAATGSCVNS